MTYCVHFSSIREILTSQQLEDKISNYPEEARVHIEYFHEVPAGTAQDPRNLWLRKMAPVTGAVTITNTKEDPRATLTAFSSCPKAPAPLMPTRT